MFLLTVITRFTFPSVVLALGYTRFLKFLPVLFNLSTCRPFNLSLSSCGQAML